MTILIRNGVVVTPAGCAPQDVLIDGERIAAVLTPGTSALGVDPAVAADRVIDAAGKFVIPGGVDAHTHMEMPFGGTRASDTFETGTRAAAWGGTTTVIDFAVQAHGIVTEMVDATVPGSYLALTQPARDLTRMR
jgi:dihydropyrimidinase